MRPGGESNGESPFFETPNLSFEGRVRNVADLRPVRSIDRAAPAVYELLYVWCLAVTAPHRSVGPGGVNSGYRVLFACCGVKNKNSLSPLTSEE